MKKTIAIIAFIFSLITGMAQDFQGKAFYKTKRKMSIKMDSTKVASEQQKMINEMLKKQFEKEYVLTFDKVQSIYKEQESLGGIQQGGIQIIMAGGSDILYRNTKEERYVNQNEFFGKPFLIKDMAKKQEWKLENESKKIGDYTCYKATTTREVTDVKRTITDGNENKEEITKTVKVVAWYTSEIPVAHGPSNYWGLPGLILEVNDGSQVMICNKLVLNPKEKLSLKEPKSGKVVTQEAYDKIVEKKMKEMEKTHHGGRKKGDGHSFEIKIEG